RSPHTPHITFFSMTRRPPRSTPFPYTTLFRSNKIAEFLEKRQAIIGKVRSAMMYPVVVVFLASAIVAFILVFIVPKFKDIYQQLDRKSTRLNSSHVKISYAVFCLKKKINTSRD